jgi:hypothetical protein
VRLRQIRAALDLVGLTERHAGGRLVEQGTTDPSRPATTTPSRALEHRLLVDVLVQMSKVLLDSKRASNAQTGHPDAKQAGRNRSGPANGSVRE